MRGKNTIFINGRYYDAVTGLAVDGPGSVNTQAKKSMDIARPASSQVKAPVLHAKVTTPKPEVVRAASQHKKTSLQKSKTLRRDAVKRPAGSDEARVSRPARAHHAVQTSPSISKFASHPHIAHSRVAAKPAAPAPSARPLHKPAVLAQAEKKLAPTPVSAVEHKTRGLSSRELKQHLIAEKLATAEQHKAAPKKRRLLSAHPRAASVMAASFALVVLAGYFTYLNMPNLSVRVAAAQAGVNAQFPEYRPDGYRFNGPIAFTPGEVTMKFQSNGGNQAYTVSQKNSSWDSQAVLDNFVTKESESYLTYSEQGLTIYTYGSNAAWVNGGVLYTITGDAPLSNEQVLRIAGSM